MSASSASSSLCESTENSLAAYSITQRWLTRLKMWDVPIAAALMALVSFSVPGRESPAGGGGVDLLALAKFGIRVGACAWFGSIVLLDIYRRLQSCAGGTVRGLCAGGWMPRVMLPWWCFMAWSAVTIAWSPLPTLSFGQWLGLAALTLLAHTVAIRYHVTDTHQLQAQSVPQSWRSMPRVLRWNVLVNQLSWTLACYSSVVLCVHIAAPEFSGLDRLVFRDGDNGFVHPTAVGATASLGIAICLAMLLLQLTRHRLLVIAMLLIHTATLYLSASRSALGMAFVMVIICAVFLVPAKRIGQALLSVGLGLLLLILMDPQVETLASQFGAIGRYFARGQSAEQLQAVSGRSEMWEAVWRQFEASPLIGHGYFVTSATGALEVWERDINHDAHNLVLQVLVSTGIVGGLVFAWALARMFGHLIEWSSREFRSSTDSTGGREFLWLIVLTGIWYAGWGQTCVTFLGPIRPESVVFFTLLGLFASHAESVRATVNSNELGCRITPSLD